MAAPIIPPKDKIHICFAHRAYRLADRFAARGTGISHEQVYDAGGLAKALPKADVLVLSFLYLPEGIWGSVAQRFASRRNGHRVVDEPELAPGR